MQKFNLETADQAAVKKTLSAFDSDNSLNETVTKIYTSAQGISLRAGDVITIAAGPANVYDFDAEVLVNGKPVLDPKTKRNKTEKKQYLAFPAEITHSDGTIDRNYKVSVRALVTPSIATELQEGKLYRSSLRHRFGKGDVTFRDVTTPGGKSVQLPVLEEDIVCTIAVGNCYAQPFGAEADYDRENKCWNNPVTMENYGYAEA